MAVSRIHLSVMPLFFALYLFSAGVQAAPDASNVVASLLDDFRLFPLPEVAMRSASYLFWSLATLSLVWSMTLVLFGRGDISELLFELVRFVLVSGFFYWLLIAASDMSGDGLIPSILDSFRDLGGQMSSNNGSLRDPANRFGNLGIQMFSRVMEESVTWREADALVGASLSVLVIIALTFVAAQAALILLMAWALAYVGIFLLGFGGSRWTSSIAVSYYKHVVAVGAAMLTLIVVITIGNEFMRQLLSIVLEPTGVRFEGMAAMLVASIVMAVVAWKVPGLLYTLVTGSKMGIFSGTASMASGAVSSGWSQAMRRDERSAALPGAAAGSASDAYRSVAADIARIDTIRQTTDFGSAHADAHAASGAGSVFGQPQPTPAWTSGSQQTRDTDSKSSDGRQESPRAQGQQPAAGAVGQTQSPSGKDSSAAGQAAAQQPGNGGAPFGEKPGSARDSRDTVVSAPVARDPATSPMAPVVYPSSVQTPASASATAPGATAAAMAQPTPMAPNGTPTSTQVHGQVQAGQQAQAPQPGVSTAAGSGASQPGATVPVITQPAPTNPNGAPTSTQVHGQVQAGQQAQATQPGVSTAMGGGAPQPGATVPVITQPAPTNPNGAPTSTQVHGQVQAGQQAQATQPGLSTAAGSGASQPGATVPVITQPAPANPNGAPTSTQVHGQVQAGQQAQAANPVVAPSAATQSGVAPSSQPAAAQPGSVQAAVAPPSSTQANATHQGGAQASGGPAPVSSSTQTATTHSSATAAPAASAGAGQQTTAQTTVPTSSTNSPNTTPASGAATNGQLANGVQPAPAASQVSSAGTQAGVAVVSGGVSNGQNGPSVGATHAGSAQGNSGGSAERGAGAAGVSGTAAAPTVSGASPSGADGQRNTSTQMAHERTSTGATDGAANSVTPVEPTKTTSVAASAQTAAPATNNSTAAVPTKSETGSVFDSQSTAGTMASKGFTASGDKASRREAKAKKKAALAGRMSRRGDKKPKLDPSKSDKDKLDKRKHVDVANGDDQAAPADAASRPYADEIAQFRDGDGSRDGGDGSGA